jgi:hypothetical protein
VRIVQSSNVLLYPGSYSGPQDVSIHELVIEALRSFPQLGKFSISFTAKSGWYLNYINLEIYRDYRSI